MNPVFSYIIMKFRSISLMWKLNIAGMIIITLFTVIIYVLILPYMEREKLSERSSKLKAVVNSAVSLIDHYDKALRKQEWSRDNSMSSSISAARSEVLQILRDMRYDKTEFFFVLDGDGNMVLHPMKPELEGTSMMFSDDADGIKVFRNMVMNSQRDGETVEIYRWQSKYSPVIIEPQITYARYYWQWDWVVCSSIYIQDITDSMRVMKFRSALYEAAAAAVAIMLLIGLVYFNLNRPLKKLLSGIEELHNDNLDHRIEVTSLDEVGYISEQFNHMVADLKESRDNLAMSEKKYRELSDMLPDIIYEADSDLRITYLNKAGFNITGYTPDDLESGLYLKDLLDRQDFDILRKKIKDKEETGIFVKHKVYLKGGGKIFGENSMNVFHDQGTPVLLRGSIRDVSEKQAFEEQLIQSQKMETIGILAGGLAHDFNNVLGGIVSTVSVLKYEFEDRDTIKGSELSSYIDIIERSGQRAVDMVKQLLTLSRKRDTEFVNVDLVKTVHNVKKICENTLDKSVIITADIVPEAALVYADPTQMEQMLLNLCVNASHAMTVMRGDDDQRGGKLAINLDMILPDPAFVMSHPESEERDYWVLSVSDTGVGMDQQTIARIFLPFFTTKSRDLGTGLGLSMVYTIIQQHKGFIDVYSERGKGSVFSIYLPVLKGVNAGDDSIARANVPCGEGTVLIIDDEDLMRTVAKKILEKCGYSVLTASDGLEGVKIFRKKHREILCVLLDLAMPKKSGDIIYDELKEIDKHVKVVLTSGFRKDERVELAMTKGIDAFMQKPYTMEKLAQVIASISCGTAEGKS